MNADGSADSLAVQGGIMSLLAASHTPDVRPLMLAGVLLAAAIPFTFSRCEVRLGRRINSPSLIADATEFRAHVLSSGLVFAALAGQMLGWPLDRPVAMAIVLWIVYAGWNTLKDAMRVLLDASLDADTLNLVRRLITGHPEVTQVNSLTGRNSGGYRFIEKEIALRVSELMPAHQIASAIEEEIRAKIPFIERVLVVHTEPTSREVLRVIAPLADDHMTVAETFGTAARFGFYDIRAADG